MEQIEEYKQIVMDRFMSLSDEEKSVLESLPGTAVGDALGKLFGPEMGDLLLMILKDQTCKVSYLWKQLQWATK